MKNSILFSICIVIACASSAQTVTQNLQKAFQQFEVDPQLKHAISSLYVIDANTGKVVFDKNSQVGLAPASTQKIITAATAFELLGKDYRYKTYIGYDVGIEKNEIQGNFYIDGNGDPTLGSKRWKNTNDSIVLKRILNILKKNGVSKIKGDIWIDDARFGINPVPDGWIWQDIGNYYGAGAMGFNWRENQYDLILRPVENSGWYTDMIRTEPALVDYRLGNFIRTGEKGSGDNAFIYYAPYSTIGFATGTIPGGVDSFIISGSIPNPSKEFGYFLKDFLQKEKIAFENNIKLYSDSLFERGSARRMMQLFDSIVSPPVDSIIHWFLQKSINLYGEALVKTFAYEKNGFGSTDGGIKIVKDFWKQKGIDENELNIGDGSGLSPGNRVTTHAQVEILKFAKKRPWFSYFYNALPEYNGMKMKSGTIKNVKGFCGYHRATNGKEYIFSFLVNNYNGSSSELVGKMYRVLNQLK